VVEVGLEKARGGLSKQSLGLEDCITGSTRQTNEVKGNMYTTDSGIALVVDTMLYSLLIK
jgi:hypothetical protein